MKNLWNTLRFVYYLTMILVSLFAGLLGFVALGRHEYSMAAAYLAGAAFFRTFVLDDRIQSVVDQVKDNRLLVKVAEPYEVERL